MTDQVSSGNGQHQHWVASSKQQAANGGSGCQQGGSMVEALPVNGSCCFVGLLDCLPLTDDICDDVLDVVEGIAGEIFIKLTQEEKWIIGRYGSDKKNYRWEKIRKMRHVGILDVPKSIAGVTIMKMTHEEVGIRRRYVCHKEMCI
jgi:hypothetical protein